MCRDESMTYRQLSHARQTLRRWSWIGFWPTSMGRDSSSERFFLGEERMDGRSPLLAMVVVGEKEDVAGKVKK